MAKYTFNDLWLSEAVRQREEHWGPLDDSAILHHIRQQPGDLADKIRQRALALSRREGLNKYTAHWLSAAKIALFVLLVFAIIAGITSGLSALDTQRNHVNILLALVALLGLHAISYMAWLVSLLTSWRSNTVLGSLWLWLSKKLARSPDASLAAQALVNTANQQGGMRWILSTLSHGFWLVLLCVATLSLLAMLAAKSYSFAWETTILSSQNFVSLTHALGALPALLGFTQPSAELVQASGNATAQEAGAQAIWSSWLIGQVVVWGILLRLVSFIFCAYKARSALARTHIDPTLPVYAGLINRLQPRAESIGIDATAPAYKIPTLDSRDMPLNWQDQHLLVGIEISPEVAWPPFSLAPGVLDIGIIESREQRHDLLGKISANPVRDLLLVCDASQTPDRGVLHYISAVASQAQNPQVYLSQASDASSHRLQQWKDALKTAGFKPNAIYTQVAELASWGQV